MSQHLNDATNTIIDLQRSARRGQACHRATELDHQALRWAAFQTQTAIRMEVRDDHLVEQNVRDVGIIPDAFGRQRLTANLHAIDAVIGHPVAQHQRTAIGADGFQSINRTGRPAWIANEQVIERIDIDVDRCRGAIDEGVVKDDRLCTADEDGTGFIEAATEAVGPSGIALASHATGDPFKVAVGDPRVSLMNLQDVEARESTLDAGHATAISEDGVIDAHTAQMAAENACPVTWIGCKGLISTGIKNTAGSVAIVFQ